MEYFQAHVVQHLLLMVIAPPLLAMGAPMTLALQTSSRSGKVRLLALLNSRPFKVLTHPLPVWFLYYFSMFAFFLTFALNFAMEPHVGHGSGQCGLPVCVDTLLVAAGRRSILFPTGR